MNIKRYEQEIYRMRMQDHMTFREVIGWLAHRHIHASAMEIAESVKSTKAVMLRLLKANALQRIRAKAVARREGRKVEIMEKRPARK